jgi:hypothetical protein
MRLLLISILSALILSASSIDSQVKIIERVISEISLSQQISMWSDDKNILTKLKEHGKFKTTSKCKDATFVILKNKKHLSEVCTHTHIFVLNYKLLSDIPQSFGALFWRKGRPNIVILEPRIKEQNIEISKNLEPYLEEKIW